MKKILLSAAAAAILIGVTGCTTSVGGTPAPQMTFSQFAPVTLNVQSISVSEAPITATDPDDVSEQFVLPPGDAVRRYAAQRFQSTGTGNGQFTILIEDARVHMRVLKEDNRVLKWSGVGQEDEYRLFFQVRVTPKPDGAISAPATIIKMERTLVMPSSTAIADREMKQVQFLEKLMADVDAKIMSALDTIPNIKR